jgi:glycosyltransferase 2 family protein
MKNNKINIIAITIISIIVIYISIKDNFLEIVNQILSINVFWLLFALLLILGFYICRAIHMYLIVKEFDKDYTIYKAIKLIIIAQFFNGITPFATGGQPAQIYLLKKENIDIHKGTTIVIEHFFVYQISLILYGFIAIILNNYFDFFPKVDFLKKLVLFGFILNAVIVVGLLIISFAKRISRFITSRVIGMLSGLRIIKDKQKTKEKWHERLNNFHDSVILLKNNTTLIWQGIVLNLIAFTFLYSIPIVILYSLGDYSSLNMVNTIVAGSYIMIMISLVPSPGSIGGVEYGFVSFFGNFIGGPTLMTLMLLWRFVTYYFGLFLGALLLGTRKERKF